MVGPAWRHRIAEAVEPYGQLAAIAEAATMSSSQLQKIANGTTKSPGVDVLARIAKAMRMTLSDLVAEPRPGMEPGDAGGRSQGSAVLAIIAERANEDGTWQADVAKAITILAGALKRDSDRKAAG